MGGHAGRSGCRLERFTATPPSHIGALLQVAAKPATAGILAQELQKAFSTRSASIEVATNALIPDFVASHGRSPNSREMLKLRQRATLATRPDKHAHPLAEQVEGWRKRAEVMLNTDPFPRVATVRDRNDLPLLRADDLTSEMLRDAHSWSVDAASASPSAAMSPWGEQGSRQGR